MGIISYIFEPVIFFSILAALFVIYMIVVRQDKNLNQEAKESIKKDKVRISELEAAKEELEKKLKKLEGELASSKKELSLSNQMYEGLKAQYNELEKTTERLTQQSPPKIAPKPGS